MVDSFLTIFSLSGPPVSSGGLGSVKPARRDVGPGARDRKIFFAQKHFFGCSELIKSVFERKNFFRLGPPLSPSLTPDEPPPAPFEPQMPPNTDQNRKTGISRARRGVFRHSLGSFGRFLGVPDRFLGVPSLG